ncbi:MULTISPECIES: triacylglycerol lipase [unclassified Streptomyces]|uniref:esterase/lipase family protein n=1 Tax=unclassified Streptomyces TaxID=2593676 RepID=UPI000F5BC39B|nr:triacylglycerol lipase [Streptomyces sp. ADI95-17]RPK61174.1 Extracellular esterase EstB precursor [Streptomyces sp. ADI95-17]WSG48763.1 triacylglycerol lipase [Streptomyces sp. NBC_01732]WSW99414.1 triacylglycerol lipase [Streptomyces sp. NBC_00987]
MRHPVLAAASALVATLALCAPAVAAPTASTWTPVIFVHGRNSDPGVWTTMISRFESAGDPKSRFFAWDYDTSLSTNEVLSAQLADYVNRVLDETGAEQVDIVAHSLGSLPSRWYIKFGGGGTTVRNWVSLAGPNHGTSLGYLCALWDQGCRDMTPGSYVVQHLNEADPTPGSTRYTTFRSGCDEQTSPTTSTMLDGAANLETSCLKHNALLTDPAVADQVHTVLK